MIDLDFSVEERAAEPVWFESVASLLDFYEDNPPPFHWLELGRDLRRLGAEGFDLYREAAHSWDPPERAECITESWATFDRPEPNQFDRLLLDEMGLARRRGWKPPADMDSLFAAIDAESGRVSQAELKLENWHSRMEWEAMQREESSMTTSKGATLPAGTPGPGGIPMLAGRGDMQAKTWAPILASVLRVKRTDGHPEMPDTGHPLRAAINEAIPGIITHGNADALAVIEAVHPATAASAGAITPAIKARAEAFRQDAERALAPDDFQRDHKGEIQRDNLDNFSFYLRGLGVEIRFNRWAERVELRGWIWRDWTRLDDVMVAKLRMRAGQTGTRFLPAKEFVWDALSALAHDNPVDPALDYLAALEAEWDGTQRLGTWLSHACGVPADDYHRAVGTITMLGLVSRIRCPGIKFDLMPVFVSEMQGTSKSTLARMLACRDEWFIENVALGVPAKELLLLLTGKSVVEISEMRSHDEVEAVKATLSATHDTGRTAYARAVTERPRRHIFVGTTNTPEFLKDPTGGRRFLPIMVQGEINLEWVRENLPQFMGEACALQSRGANVTLPREIWGIASEHQQAATAKTSAEVLLANWFAGDGACWISSANIVLLFRQALGRDVPAGKYAATMRKMGFVSKTHRSRNAPPVWAWVRGEPGSDMRGYGAQLTHEGRPALQMLMPTPRALPLPALPNANMS